MPAMPFQTDYVVHRASDGLRLTADFNDPLWSRAPVVEVAHFHPRSSDHRPRTRARLLYDGEYLYLQFRAEDRYVRSVHTRFMDPVYTDSCVEFFVEPYPGRGYFNFEINAGGSLLATWVVDPRRQPDGSLADARPLSPEEAAAVAMVTTLPRVVEPEIAEPVTWGIAARIPLAGLLARTGAPPPRPGAVWRGNFYKCADGTSHPHWASWQPIGEELNFHVPERFGRLIFEQAAGTP